MKEAKHFIRTETACFTGHRMIPGQDLAAIRQKTSSAVTDAYNKAAHGNGFSEEFVYSDVERGYLKKYN